MRFQPIYLKKSQRKSVITSSRKVTELDIAENGDLVAELLLSNEANHTYLAEVVRLSVDTGEAVLALS